VQSADGLFDERDNVIFPADIGVHELELPPMSPFNLYDFSSTQL
jgi:hypothetical protein